MTTPQHTAQRAMSRPRPAGRAGGALATTLLVARREVTERLRSRLIWALTALSTLLVVALIVLPAVVGQPAQPLAPTVVGLVGPSAQALGPSLRAAATAARVGVRVVDVATAAAARAGLEDGSLGVALSVGAGTATARIRGAAPASGPLGRLQGLRTAQAQQAQTLSPTVQALLRAVVDTARQRRALAALGVPPAAARAALTALPLTVTALHPVPAGQTADQAAHDVAALAAAVLLYVSLAIYGAAIAGGVAQEKTSRTAEILLAAVRPSQLLAGKVAGIGVIGVGQVALTVVAGLIANAIVKSAVIPSTIWALLPAVLLWFVLGYALYAFAFATAGALVGRQEEVQFVTLPFTLLLVGGFLLTYLLIANPGAGWLRVLSFLPPLAPVLMSARVALGVVDWWEMPVAALLTLAAVYGMARLAARIYAPALVRGGARLSWRDALRLGADRAPVG